MHHISFSCRNVLLLFYKKRWRSDEFIVSFIEGGGYGYLGEALFYVQVHTIDAAACSAVTVIGKKNVDGAALKRFSLNDLVRLCRMVRSVQMHDFFPRKAYVC